MDLTNLTVLLVEDDPDHAELVRGALADAPTQCQIDHVTSLVAAREMLRDEERHYSVVLLDLGLPEGTGLETLKHFMGIAGDLPIVVMTSLGDAADGLSAVRMGAQDYFIKFPSEPMGLYRTLAFAVERKRATDEVTRRKKMLQTFAAAVGHDLTSPPRHILALVEMMVEDVGEDLPPVVIRRLGQIRERAERMTLLLNGVLSYAQLGAAEPERVMTRVSDLLSAVIEDVPPEDRHRVSILGDTDIYVDPSLAYLFMRNLVLNGLKYWRQEPSTVIVDAGVVRTDPNSRLVTVRDTGMGIDRAIHGSLFLPGKRGVAQDEFAGTGYGLAIAKEAVETHGGTIWMDSFAGFGTIFHIRLPAKPDLPGHKTQAA